MNADGSGQRRLTHNNVRDDDPRWSPDGRRIAFVDNWRQVYVMNADGSGHRRLTRNRARSVAPAWSPDGQRIAFERLGDVYVIDADGTGERRLSQIGTHPSWSPDGQKIAFEMNADIYVMNADGSARQKVDARESPSEARRSVARTERRGMSTSMRSERSPSPR